jgi:hypothetical protein
MQKVRNAKFHYKRLTIEPISPDFMNSISNSSNQDKLHVNNAVEKSIAIHVIGCGGPWGCEMLGLPHFLDNVLADGDETVSLTLHGNIMLFTFCAHGKMA